MPQDFLIVIPARYASSRFPGKPLSDINGKSMLQRVWDKCVEASAGDKVVIATDDEKIELHCKELNMNVIQTSTKCLTGTDRVAEVAKKINADFYINVQGDEPLIMPSDIKKVINTYIKTPGNCICGMAKITSKKDFYNPNIPKVVTSKDNKLLYITRAAVPTSKTLEFSKANKQVCIYAFTPESLKEYGVGTLKEANEEIEDIEILRLLEKGYKVSMVKVSDSSIAVDTPEDLDKVKKYLNEL